MLFYSLWSVLHNVTIPDSNYLGTVHAVTYPTPNSYFQSPQTSRGMTVGCAEPTPRCRLTGLTGTAYHTRLLDLLVPGSLRRID